MVQPQRDLGRRSGALAELHCTWLPIFFRQGHFAADVLYFGGEDSNSTHRDLFSTAARRCRKDMGTIM